MFQQPLDNTNILWVGSMLLWHSSNICTTPGSIDVSNLPRCCHLNFCLNLDHCCFFLPLRTLVQINMESLKIPQQTPYWKSSTHSDVTNSHETFWKKTWRCAGHFLSKMNTLHLNHVMKCWFKTTGIVRDRHEVLFDNKTIFKPRFPLKNRKKIHEI